MSPTNVGEDSSVHHLKPMADESYLSGHTSGWHRRRSSSGGSDRVRFVPVLEPLAELAEAAG